MTDDDDFEREATRLDLLRWRLADRWDRWRGELVDLWQWKLNPHPHCVHCVQRYWTRTPWREFYCPHPNCQAAKACDQADDRIRDLAATFGMTATEVRALMLDVLRETNPKEH